MKTTPLPLVICGPLLRRVTSNEVCLWLVTTEKVAIDFHLFDSQQQPLYCNKLSSAEHTAISIGTRAYIQCLQIHLGQTLKTDSLYGYDLTLKTGADQNQLSALVPELLYHGESCFTFKLTHQIDYLLQGSCRKPHHLEADGLVQVDRVIEETWRSVSERPDLLLMTGDQVYVDDVAGPMLAAIHQVIQRLGLFDEKWSEQPIQSSQQLMQHPSSYYQRDHLLPQDEQTESFYQLLIAGKHKPIFTSVNARNHLVSLSEMFAMYCLVWSPSLWQHIEYDNKLIAEQFQSLYRQEQQAIDQFVRELPFVARALAHISSYMIFDDHDVTDDWNLNRNWEDVAYSHPYSRRIIGNALTAYWLCQAWGNSPDGLDDLNRHINDHFAEHGLIEQDKLIDRLLHWSNWHYAIDCQPVILVLDTRTQRWRSESNPNKPSGLMDWESLSDLQQSLKNQSAVIMVSAAPVFGVKLIEAIQSVFTYFGKPLMVDAENWMAHRGTANVLLNILRSPATPPNFVILSGDVHYSFVYDVSIKRRKNSPHIVQITSSGFKNSFPDQLLGWLDRLNAWLYHRHSPLNWLTKRRSMSIKPRKNQDNPQRYLVNSSGVGSLRFDSELQRVDVSVIASDGETIQFVTPPSDE